MKKWALAIILAITALTSSFGLPIGQAHAAPVLASGSTNGDVWDLQYRLWSMGYYKTAMDGIFGPATVYAVRRYQSDYGLSADGVVGAQTWTSLKKFSLDKSELDILAHLIYSEARGESYTGQVAVGAVVLNRMQSSKFPDTIRGVVFQKNAFTAVDDGQFWMTPNSTAYKAALDAVRGWDPSHGALYYFNPRTATSSWIWSRPHTITIGHHIFAK